jgi:hypothetical protein
MPEEKRVEEWRWKPMTRSLVVKKIKPTDIVCKPEDQAQHTFQPAQVYLLTDEQQPQQYADAIVICPTHKQPISVTITNYSLMNKK